jgi:hypothetical protein
MRRVYCGRVAFTATIFSFWLGSNRCERRELFLGVGCAEFDCGDSVDGQRGIISAVLVRVWFPLLDRCAYGN